MLCFKELNQGEGMTVHRTTFLMSVMRVFTTLFKRRRWGENR